MAEAQGLFWLNGEDDEPQKLSGTLVYGHGVRNTLEVLGHLDQDLWGSSPYVNITGVINQGFECVTLRNCFAISTEGFPDMPGSSQRFVCNQVFKGRLSFGSEEQINAKWLTVSMWPLTQWVDAKLIEFDRKWSPSEQQQITVLPDSTATISKCQSDGLTFDVEICSSAGVFPSRRTLTAHPQSHFRIIPEFAETPVEKLTSVAFKLKLLLTMLADKPAVINTVAFKVPEPEYDATGNTMMLYQEWLGGPPSEQDNQSDWVSIPFRDLRLENVGQNIIPQWFRLFDEYSPAVQWLLGGHFHPAVPTDQQFNAAFTAVERLLSQSLGPDRPGRQNGYANGESKASVLSLIKFVRDTGAVDIRYFNQKDSGDLDKWAKHVMSMRDEFTVHLDFKEDREPPDDFHDQANILTCVGVGFLMGQMGIKKEIITHTLDYRLRGLQ